MTMKNAANDVLLYTSILNLVRKQEYFILVRPT